MTYVDGIVLPVLAGREADYRAMAERTAAMFLEHGALRVTEALGDDLPRGERTDFWRAVDARDGERIALAWIIWPDRATRDAGMARVRDDPRMRDPHDLPIDGGRMIFGGFEVFLDAAR